MLQNDPRDVFVFVVLDHHLHVDYLLPTNNSVRGQLLVMLGNLLFARGAKAAPQAAATADTGDEHVLLGELPEKVSSAGWSCMYGVAITWEVAVAVALLTMLVWL